jgi:hypothetical protein
LTPEILGSSSPTQLEKNLNFNRSPLSIEGTRRL